MLGNLPINIIKTVNSSGNMRNKVTDGQDRITRFKISALTLNSI